MDDTARIDGITGDQGRRDAIKKLGVGAVGAAAAWSAPTILSTTAAAAATGNTPLVCPGCGLNRVTNGGFESVTGTPPQPIGWTTSNARTYVYLASGINVPPGGLDRFGGTDAAGGSLSQTFAVDSACVGRPYSFSCYAYSVTNPGRIEIQFGGTNGSNDVTIPVAVTVPNMSLYSRAGTIPSGTTSVTIRFQADQAGFLGADVVSFVIGC